MAKGADASKRMCAVNDLDDVKVVMWDSGEVHDIPSDEWMAAYDEIRSSVKTRVIPQVKGRVIVAEAKARRIVVGMEKGKDGKETWLSAFYEDYPAKDASTMGDPPRANAAAPSEVFSPPPEDAAPMGTLWVTREDGATVKTEAPSMPLVNPKALLLAMYRDLIPSTDALKGCVVRRTGPKECRLMKGGDLSKFVRGAWGPSGVDYWPARGDNEDVICRNPEHAIDMARALWALQEGERGRARALADVKDPSSAVLWDSDKIRILPVEQWMPAYDEMTKDKNRIEWFRWGADKWLMKGELTGRCTVIALQMNPKVRVITVFEELY